MLRWMDSTVFRRSDSKRKNMLNRSFWVFPESDLEHFVNTFVEKMTLG